MQHRVTDYQIEGVVLVGNAFGVGDPAVNVEPERLPIAGGDLDHARGKVSHRSAPRHPGLDQIEQKESGAAAQFERPVIREVPDRLVGNDRVEPAAGIVDAALVIGDRPLIVVALRFPVVIEHLGQLGVLERGRHLFGGGVRIGSRVKIGHARQPNWPGPAANTSP